MGFSYILYDSFYRPVDNKGINKQKYCYGVAKKTLLKQCQDCKLGLCAGEFFYKDLTRDAFFGCMGLDNSEYKLVEKVLYTLKDSKEKMVLYHLEKILLCYKILIRNDLGNKVAVYKDDKAFKEPSDKIHT